MCYILTIHNILTIYLVFIYVYMTYIYSCVYCMILCAVYSVSKCERICIWHTMCIYIYVIYAHERTHTHIDIDIDIDIDIHIHIHRYVHACISYHIIT